MSFLSLSKGYFSSYCWSGHVMITSGMHQGSWSEGMIWFVRKIPLTFLVTCKKRYVARYENKCEALPQCTEIIMEGGGVCSQTGVKMLTLIYSPPEVALMPGENITITDFSNILN